MKLFSLNQIKISSIKKFVIYFYIIGLLGFLIPYSRSLFIIITPFALLLNTYLIIAYHSNLKDLRKFIVIIVLGYIIEVIGVNTGKVFGDYYYGKTLGIKIFNTPLIIGLNWFFLSYSSKTITDYLTQNKKLTLLIAPLFMVIYDIVLEQVASKIDMWYWNNSVVPIMNYISWYIISFIFVLILNAYRINTNNPVAIIILLSQFIFFIMLNIFL